jgi:hypothetical protein
MHVVYTSFLAGTDRHCNVSRLRRGWGKRLSSYVLLFLAVAGVLAVIFSAISQDDDSTQPDFITARSVSQLSMLSFNANPCSSSCCKRLSAISPSLEVPSTSLGGGPAFPNASFHIIWRIEDDRIFRESSSSPEVAGGGRAILTCSARSIPAVL